jgi:16S rRNA (adenine1518-N6/adenine1519-N6)-dimethyltransferase
MTVMIQKEVAEKFAALPKTKEFTSLAILAQSIGTAAILFDVSPESFEPQPKVVSSILKIDKQKEFVEGKFSGLFESDEQLQKFKKYLRCSFQSPRKTWLKNISSEFEKACVEEVMHDQNLPETIRPHEISVLSHHLLFKTLRLNDARKRSNATTEE